MKYLINIIFAMIPIDFEQQHMAYFESPPSFFNSHSAVKYLRETENHWCCVNFCEGEMFFFDKKCNFFETKHHLHMEYFADRIWSSLNNFWHFEVFVCFRVYWCKCFSQRFKFTTDLLGDVLNRCLFAYVFVWDI
jgi:hypothetical protein